VSLIFIALLPYKNILTTKFSQITVLWIAAFPCMDSLCAADCYILQWNKLWTI